MMHKLVSQQDLEAFEGTAVSSKGMEGAWSFSRLCDLSHRPLETVQCKRE